MINMISTAELTPKNIYSRILFSYILSLRSFIKPTITKNDITAISIVRYTKVCHNHSRKGVPKLDVVWKKVSHFRNTGEVLVNLPKLVVVWKKDK